MSVWHEVQIELARDAVDELILKQGEDAILTHVRNLIGEAEDTATDLPEDSPEEAIACLERSRALLERSRALLADAGNKMPQNEDKPYRVLRNKLKHAQEALEKTKEDFLTRV